MTLIHFVFLQNFRYKLLKHSAPVLHPPKNVSLEVISKEITEINKKSRIGRPPKSIPLSTKPSKDQKDEYVRKVLETPEVIESCSSRQVLVTRFFINLHTPLKPYATKWHFLNGLV